MNRIGTKDAGYLFEEELGMGGFGTVYRASKDGAAVAIKVLLADLMATPQAIQRFDREVSTIRNISHVSCVKVFDSGRLSDGSPYFSMELLEGEDLSDYLRREGRLSCDRVLEILQPVCEVLAIAHGQSVVHRDVKASNVFLCSDGRVKLLDFGIAKITDMPGMTLTLSRQLVGTPSAMTPEQLTGGTVDGRTDVYALGALAYFMFTGIRAFSSPSATLMQYLHQRAARPRPSRRVPLPAAVDRVITTAMSIAPELRYASVGAFWGALDSALGGGPDVPGGLSPAVVVFASLGPCGDREALARQGIVAMAQCMDRLTACGFRLISQFNHGFVCVRLSVGVGVGDVELAKIRSAFVAAAPKASEMRWKQGNVYCDDGVVVSGQVLVPMFSNVSEEGIEV